MIESGDRNVMQTAYEIRVFEGRKPVWNSGRVESDNSVAVPYGGAALKSGTRYYWQVRVWDNRNRASKWSARATWLTGLFSIGDFEAQWIEQREQTEAAPLFRKSFALKKPVASAVAYITSHGMHEAYLNGRKIGNEHFAPGWTTYDKRLQYRT